MHGVENAGEFAAARSPRRGVYTFYAEWGETYHGLASSGLMAAGDVATGAAPGPELDGEQRALNGGQTRATGRGQAGGKSCLASGVCYVHHMCATVCIHRAWCGD